MEQLTKLDKAMIIVMAWTDREYLPPPNNKLVNCLVRRNTEAEINKLYESARHVLTHSQKELIAV